MEMPNLEPYKYRFAMKMSTLKPYRFVMKISIVKSYRFVLKMLYSEALSILHQRAISKSLMKDPFNAMRYK